MAGSLSARKGTWTAKHHSDHPIVSRDVIRNALGVSATDNQGQINQAAHERGKEHLLAGCDIVWSAIYVTRQNRPQVLRLQRDDGARLEAVYLEPGPDQQRRQNRDRSDVVPEAVIDYLSKKLEPPQFWEAHTASIT